VIQNAEVLYPYHKDLRSRLYELIGTSDRLQSPNGVEQIIKAAATVVNWSKRSANDGQMHNQDESLRYCKLIFRHLMDLVHVSISQHAKSLPPVELEQLLTDVLQVMKTIF